MQKPDGTIFIALLVFGCVAGTVVGAEPNAPAAEKTAEKAATPAMFGPRNTAMPALFLVGDSTVHNSKPGSGWGDHLETFFDTSKIGVYNRARGGRSSRTFIEEGLWQKVLAEMKPGDYVLLQMGHNDGGGVPSRLTLPGIGEETQTQDANNTSNSGPVTLHTYGWYLRQYIQDARSRKATLILVTPVLTNTWAKDGTNKNKYGQYAFWMKQVAEKEKVPLLDLNAIMLKHYNELGQNKVSSEFFGKGDITHTVPTGAKANASYVIEGLKEMKDCGLTGSLKKEDKPAAAK
jgi:rhamnogalacturonan acetylesterase